MLKRRLISLILLFIFIFYLNLFSKGKDAEIDLFYKDKYVMSIPIEKFEEMKKTHKSYYEELKAEENNRVICELEKNPWSISEGEIFTSEMYIIWKDEQGNEIKRVTGEISITRDTDSRWHLLYLKIMSYLFIPSIVLNVISIGIVILLILL